MKRLLYAALFVIGFLILLLWFRPASRLTPLGQALIVGTTPDFPPYAFFDANNEITGFDIDVVKEVARRIGSKIQLEAKPFNMLLPQLQLGQIHIIAAGMSPTPERSKNVRFTDSYLTGNPLIVLTKQPNIKTFDDLKGKSVIVNTGYIADIYLSSFEGINLTRLSTVQDGIEALNQNRADAFVAALTTIAPYLAKHKNLTHFVIEETDESIALAVSKTVPESFFAKITDALDEMEKDNTLASLKRKWAVI